MKPKRAEKFKVETMDSLGQGVSKQNGAVTFITKTLPGEEGTVEVFADRKGVSFGKAVELTQSSELRIRPECPHFSECPSCHYLHVDYPTETKFKLQSFEKLFYKLPLQNVRVLQSSQRLHYRNRVQLHYDTKNQKLGMLDPLTRSIVSVPNCKIAIGPVEEKMRALYADNSWLMKAPKHQPQGHVEIYFRQGETTVSWNKPYAQGGFTQVNAEMNVKMKAEIAQWFEDKKESELLDLFAGQGNLSNELSFSKRLCVDVYQEKMHPDFLSCDLYDRGALKRVKEVLTKKKISPQYLIIDPPSSGMRDLNVWTEEFKPKAIAYVSCDPHTLVRDLQTLENYFITDAVMLDFFPSTFHFESLIFLQRKG